MDNSETPEDETLLYVLSSSDVDGDELSYTASSSNGDVIINDSILSLTPSSNYNGDIQVNVTVSDGELTDSGTFIVTVISVNDPPELDPLEDTTISEDNPLEYELSATDPDDQRSLIYTASSSNGVVSLEGPSLTFMPPENYNGDVIIDVTVSCLLYTSPSPRD